MDDYIKRSDALDAFTYEHGDLIPEVGRHGEQTEIWVYDIKRKLRSIRAADVVEVVHGKDISPCEKGSWFCCSVCGFGFDDYYSHDERMMVNNELNYCPNCGAKMDR